MQERPEGLLLVDKPAGVTSHDVVLIVRRIYGERSIGHLGTLDPFATGLLVLLIGRATRLANFIISEPKVYEATIRFGSETDTDDCTGAVTATAPVPSTDAIDSAISSLTGDIDQVPPDYSAKSVDGTRAYAAARKGAALALEPVRVRVHEWIVRDRRNDEIDVTITCGTGTYIRALARDLGRLTGSAAHLASLRRSRSGPFDVRDAHSLDQLKVSPPSLRQLEVVARD
ncbi:MAG TPA: tRNA pseudouridine(55) synthase TruB [Gemmatimonadaceae bacterium]|nr:tRNA pseudouridine(55) synthase TruB [Gemmatimonadaceae bacterium]